MKFPLNISFTMTFVIGPAFLSEAWKDTLSYLFC